MNDRAWKRFIRLVAAIPVSAPACARAILPDGFTPIGAGHVDFSFCLENGIWKPGRFRDFAGTPWCLIPLLVP